MHVSVDSKRRKDVEAASRLARLAERQPAEGHKQKGEAQGRGKPPVRWYAIGRGAP